MFSLVVNTSLACWEALDASFALWCVIKNTIAAETSSSSWRMTSVSFRASRAPAGAWTNSRLASNSFQLIRHEDPHPGFAEIELAVR